MSCNERILTTAGLDLRLNPDGESYSLVGIGKCTEKNISVGICEDGLPVVIIADDALKYGKNVESITLGESVHTIGMQAFSYCDNLKNVKITAVERIHWLAFNNCRSLEEIDLGEKLYFIDERAFEGCSSLSSVRLPASIREIGARAFTGLPLVSAIFLGTDGEEYSTPLVGDERKLANMLSDRNAYTIRKKRTISHLVPEGAVVNTVGISLRINYDGKSYIADGAGHMDFHTKEVSIGYHEDGRPVIRIAKDAFENVSRAGIDVVRIGDTVKAIEEGAFNRAEFKRLELSEGLEEIGDYAFYSTPFDSLTLPSTVTRIGKKAFYQCREIKGELVLPEGLKRIEEESFSHLFRITGTLVIPAGVTYIGSEAFAFDVRLDGIVFADTEGWEYEGEPIDLSDPKKNAELLTDMFAKELKKTL